MTLNTVEDAVKAIEKVVEERGVDYVYQAPKPANWDTYAATYLEEGEPIEFDPLVENCRYRDEEGNPSCIIGKVVAAEYGTDALNTLHEGMTVRAQDIFTTLSPEVQRVLSAAQQEQDARKPYGVVLAAVKEEAAK